jgi:diadenosine tetraphosphate (Ap4A) HIT family hydrolase
MTTPPELYLTFPSLKEAKINGIAPWDDLYMDLFNVKVYRDRYPVTLGHLLFVPERDAPGNIAEAVRLAVLMGDSMVRRNECQGYNVGLNRGSVAGQTVMYPHVHLIPRRAGDCTDPVGGVRGVIPGQANYRTPHYQPPQDLGALHINTE